MTTFGSVLTDTILNRQFIIPIALLRKGVTAPTENLRGTTDVPVITFANTAELVSVGFTMPIQWDNGAFSLIFEWCLVNVQTNNDALDITVDYIIWENPPDSGNSILKTSTQVTGLTTVTTADGLAIGDVYRMSIPIAAGDANNPTANGKGLSFRMGLTNVIEVAAIDLKSICIAYEASY